MNARISGIEYYLPAEKLSNEALTELFPGRTAEELAGKTGVWSRHVSAPQECSSDLGVAAAQKLLASGVCSARDIDFVLFCTQTPDYFLPATACFIQQRLGIPTSAGALDFNLGCSGYVYGLGLATGLIQSGQASRVLLMTADVVTKFIQADDRSMRALIGDAGTATLVEAAEGNTPSGLGPFAYGTDGRGADYLIVREGALRDLSSSERSQSAPARVPTVQMSGQKILEFAVRAVPAQLKKLLAQSGLDFSEVDLFVFHQASRYILDMLRHVLKIPAEKYYICLSDCGNTVGSTIPIALKRASEEGKLAAGHKVILCGFGVGLSWATTLVRWTDLKNVCSNACADVVPAAQ